MAKIKYTLIQGNFYEGLLFYMDSCALSPMASLLKPKKVWSNILVVLSENKNYYIFMISDLFTVQNLITTLNTLTLKLGGETGGTVPTTYGICSSFGRAGPTSSCSSSSQISARVGSSRSRTCRTALILRAPRSMNSQIYAVGLLQCGIKT